MKKIYLLFTAFIIITLMPITAMAADEDTGDSDTESAISLSIDDANIYDGMAKSYSDGYTPTVKGGYASIVLPLLAGGNLKNNTLTATLGLGDTSSSPFVYKNYQKAFGLLPHTVKDKKGANTEVTSYLVSFKLALKKGRVDGTYPVTIEVKAQSEDGSAVEQSFTCYVTITDGKNPNAPQPTEKPQSKPKLLVSGYTISPSLVEAGGEFTVNVTLENTSETKSIKNITVTVTCDANNLQLENDSNVIFIDKISKGDTADLEIKYKTDMETPAQRYNILLAMEYDSSDTQGLSSSGMVTAEVSQPMRVEMKTPKVESKVNAGDTMTLSFQVMNLGRGKIYNVRADISAPGLIPTETAFIGNMEAGTSSSADMDVFVGTKDMSEGYEGDDKYGFTSGKITLTYEDAAGKQYTQDVDISTTINEPVITASASTDDKKLEKASQWWISVIIAALVVAGLAAFLVVRKKSEGKNNEDF